MWRVVCVWPIKHKKKQTEEHILMGRVKIEVIWRLLYESVADMKPSLYKQLNIKEERHPPLLLAE